MPISLTVFSQLFLPPPLHAASLWISLYSLWTYIVLLGGTSTTTFLLNIAYQFVCGILEDLENKIRHLLRQNLLPSIASQMQSFMGVFAQVSQYFLWPINYLGTQHQSWLKRQFKMKKTVKKETAFFTGQSQSFSFFARPSHCCEMQTQLPPNEAPKQTTSSLDLSCRELIREAFIRAVRV